MKQNEGFIIKIVLIVIALVLLKYFFHFDVLEYLRSPQAQKIIQPVWHVILSFYNWLDNFVRGLVTKSS